MNKTINNFKINKSLINDLLVFYKPMCVDYATKYDAVNGCRIVKREYKDRIIWNTKFEEYLIYYQTKVGLFVKELINKLKELDKQGKGILLTSLNFVWHDEIIYWYTFVDYCTTPNLLVPKEAVKDLINTFWNNFNELIGED